MRRSTRKGSKLFNFNVFISILLLFFYFFYFTFHFSRAAPAAYGGSQAEGLIRAVAYA